MSSIHRARATLQDTKLQRGREDALCHAHTPEACLSAFTEFLPAFSEDTVRTALSASSQVLPLMCKAIFSQRHPFINTSAAMTAPTSQAVKGASPGLDGF